MAAKKKVKKQTAKVQSVVPAPQPKERVPEVRVNKPLHDALVELMGQVNKADHKVIAFASDVPNVYELRRPSGVMQLDIDTGGGLPAGGLCYLTGPDGAGKSHLLLKYMTQHQKIYGENSCLAIAAIEGGFDFKRALQIGMKIRIPKKIVEQWRQARADRNLPDFTKDELAAFNYQIGEFILIAGQTGEEAMGAVLDCVKKNIFGIIGIDSINGLLPKANVDKELSDEEKRAAHATLITRFLHHYIPITSNLDRTNETTLVFIQQVRANAQKATAPSYIQKYLPDWAAAGSWAGRHFKLVDIIISNGQVIKHKSKDETKIVGKQIRWHIEKGKAGTHDNIDGEVSLYYNGLNGGIDDIDTILVTGGNLGVIRETGRGVHIIRPQTNEQVDFGPISNIRDFKKMMEIDFDFQLAVRREVLGAAEVQCLYQ